MTYRKGFFFAIGLQGSGKTAFITKLAVDNFYETPRKVYSNYTLKVYRANMLLLILKRKSLRIENILIF